MNNINRQRISDLILFEVFMGRFNDIMRADELKADKDAYDLWLRKTRAEKRAAYQATITATGNKRSNVGAELAYIFPFGLPQARKVVLGVNVVAEGEEVGAGEEAEAALITKLRAAVIGAASYAYIPPTSGAAAVPGAGGVIIDSRGKKIKPAKVKLVEVGARVEGIVSRITGRPYSYRKKNSVSSSFGQQIGGANTEYETAKNALRAALETTDGNYTAYFTPQGEVDIAVTAAAP